MSPPRGELAGQAHLDRHPAVEPHGDHAPQLGAMQAQEPLAGLVVSPGRPAPAAARPPPPDRLRPPLRSCPRPPLPPTPHGPCLVLRPVSRIFGRRRGAWPSVARRPRAPPSTEAVLIIRRFRPHARAARWRSRSLSAWAVHEKGRGRLILEAARARPQRTRLEPRGVFSIREGRRWGPTKRAPGG